MDSSCFSLTNLATAVGFFTLLHTIFSFLNRKFRSYQATKTMEENERMEENKTMASSSLVPSSSPCNLKHHVFPSFHGADVRRSFLSHIVKELRSKAIDLFIDNDIERSKSIGPELIEAIRGSRIAIIVLSKNYASSTWCLDELVEIIRCRDVLDQTVIVLFYEVDPTNVKKQTGDFGKVFRKTCKGKTEDHIRRWKHALAEVAKIAGYHSTNWDNEAKMIEDIAANVSNKLNLSTPSRDFDDLVGMENHMFNMEPLLQLDVKEVRMIGIWGPSGIGKTTIARFLFNQHSKDFQLSVFMENIKANYPIPNSCSDDYSLKLKLQEDFVSKIISQKDFKIPHLGIVEDRLKDKKVFVVLDDVNHLIQLEAMAKETRWFGPSSRIIITAQDRRLLEAGGVNHNHIYNVDFPSKHEALQMFCMYAFGQKFPKDGFEWLAWQVTSLAGELPLGLRVIGSYFRGMSNQEDWKKALPRLKTRLNGEIKSILKFSYDLLHDEDKNLFLHIACFFNGELVDIVEGCLANSLIVSDVTHGLDVLAEKSLIFLEEGRVRMHNLLILLGKEIVQKQSDPGKRRFLFDTRDIDEVLSDGKADTSNVIGIDIWTLSDNEEDIAFAREGALERFYNLQFLRIFKNGVNLQSLNSISRRLRYLSIFRGLDLGFPLPCFLSDFQPKFLVKLSMEYCPFEKLWEGIQPLKNLKWMNLSNSKFLKVLPDLSTAINLCELQLEGCSSLVELPSFGKAIHLRELNLTGCVNLMQLPSSIGNLVNLEELDLSYCESLRELPSSMKSLRRLSKLELMGCSKLVVCLTNINLESLTELDLSDCSLLEIEDFNPSGTAVKQVSSTETQELGPWMGRISRLRRLVLSGMQKLVSIPQLPYSIEELDAENCESLERLESIGNLINLEELNLSYCSSLVELPSSMKNLCRLSKLELVGCSKLEVCLTNINLESLEYLDLSDCSLLYIEDFKPTGTTIQEVPLVSKLELASSCETQELGPWIGRKSRLRLLVLNNMQKLVSLPQLPYSIVVLEAVNCESLERLDCSFLNPKIILNFAYCFKLNQEARDLIIHTPTNEYAYAVLPGREVPACFPYRASGDSITVKLNQKPLRTSTKFQACLILAGEQEIVGVSCRITSKQDALIISPRKELYLVLLEHMYTFEVEAVDVTSTELVFEFKMDDEDFELVEIKECGIKQLLDVPSCNEHYKRFRDSDEDSGMERQMTVQRRR